MSSQRLLESISCTRCQAKKIKCNRVNPQCDKCEAAGAECIYLPRKTRPVRRLQVGVDDKDVLANILRRLERLEDHCELNQEVEDDSMSVSSQTSETVAPNSTSLSLSNSNARPSPRTAREMWNLIKNPETRPPLLSDAFSHLRNLEDMFFSNARCINAIEAVIDEIEFPDTTPAAHTPPTIPKDVAREGIEKYFDYYQFPAFRVPLEKKFLLSIPDLLEIPHVQLDCTSRIIYYNVLLHGVLLGSRVFPKKSEVSQHIYRTCLALVDDFLGEVKNTYADLSAACFMVSMTLEGSDIELSWRLLSAACGIAKALGYFDVDSDPEVQVSSSSAASCNPTPLDIEHNRNRFEFWHLLRIDCLFRISFGKPALITKGSWAVNFPQLSINGVEDPSNSTIEIHFLASMRLTLVMMHYLDYIDTFPDSNIISEGAIDLLWSEVLSILRTWKPADLVGMARNHVDAWFSVDIILGCDTMFMVLEQARTANQTADSVCPDTLGVAVDSLTCIRQFMMSSWYAHWGVSLVLLHQFTPLFIVCLNRLLGGHQDPDEDPLLLPWCKGFVERTAAERPELRPVMAMMKTLILACERLD
ncbi:hypothetical protein BJY01DRAFT_261390 [Aspergillus pseudoustus]|uniref:Zn(2)-C6 fungal-type domain-containing protein n=1 Tax=Aspergillus pseudoustus TaxID=1810923 RepID=A0ABR4IMS4_9EURO